MVTDLKNNVADYSFRRRALAEAARYGSDPWVFVRELLQNARDAGAREVLITTSQARLLGAILPAHLLPR